MSQHTRQHSNSAGPLRQSNCNLVRLQVQGLHGWWAGCVRHEVVQVGEAIAAMAKDNALAVREDDVRLTRAA